MLWGWTSQTAGSTDRFDVSHLPTRHAPPNRSDPNRMFGSTPVIKLGDHFKKVANYQKRFKSIPNLLELDHLTVSGDVTFGRNVQLRGTVIVVANEGSKIDIADGSVLENSEWAAKRALWRHVVWTVRVQI